MSTPGWANWSGRQTSSPRQIFAPRSEAEFVAAVREARTLGIPVRAVGASHSHSRVAATDGVLVTTDDWQGLMSADVDNRQAVLRSGTRIFQAGAELFAHGLGLRNQGDIDKQSIAGAIGTGTHGTGPTLAGFSAAATSVRLVLASGDVVTVSEENEPDLFEVARLSLGGVGLVTEVGLAVREAYTLHERQWFEHPDDVFARIDQLVAATRHFEFFWDPQRDSCACKSLDETGAPPDPLPDLKYERIGWSHEIISSIRDNRHTEMEYSVPASAGPACFAEIRAMVRSEFPDLTWPIEYRTVAADDVWISTASGRETVTISAHQDIALDDRPLFDACERIFRSHDGRPHWGKVHNQTGSQLTALYPKLRQWWDVRDRFDPDGVFVTPELERLRP